MKRKTGLDRILMGHYSFFLENNGSSLNFLQINGSSLIISYHNENNINIEKIGVQTDEAERQITISFAKS